MRRGFFLVPIGSSKGSRITFFGKKYWAPQGGFFLFSKKKFQIEKRAQLLVGDALFHKAPRWS